MFVMFYCLSIFLLLWLLAL